MTTIETLVAALALRGAWDDPERPYWSLGAALSASLLAAVVAVAYRKPDHKYASGALLHLAIVLAGAAAEQHATVEFWLLHLMALGVQALAWSLAERRLEREQTAESRGELPAFRYAAAGLGVSLFCATIAGNVLRAAGWLPVDIRLLEPFTFQLPPDASPSFLLSPLAWTAWGALAAASIVMLRDIRAVFRWEGAYSLGLAGICLAVERSTSSPLGLVQGLALGVSGYLLVVALLEQFGEKLNLPGFGSMQNAKRELDWLDPTQLVISLLVAGASLWLVLNATPPVDRLPGSLAAVLLFAAALIQAREPERQGSAAWRTAALAFGALGAAELGWTWLTGEGEIFWLQRKVIAAAALFLTVLACQFVVPKLSRSSPAWIESGRRASIALGGLFLPLLAALLIQEWRLHVPGRWSSDGRPGVRGHGRDVGRHGRSGVTIRRVCRARPVAPVIAGPDGLRLRGRAVCLADRVSLPHGHAPVASDQFSGQVLDAGRDDRRLRRRRLERVFPTTETERIVGTAARTALLAPLVPAIGHWLRPALNIDIEMVLFLAAAFYGLQATLKRSLTLSCLAIISGNAALWLLWSRLGIDFSQHPQLWLIPIALVTLVAEHIHQGRLSSQQAGAVRYIALAVIYVSSTADVFLSHVGRDLSMSLVFVLMGLSIAGVLAGIMLQVRSFLYLGVTFLLVDLSIVVFHAAWDRGHIWVFWLSGIALGAAIIALFAVFEKHRNDLAPALDRFKQWS